MIARRVALLLAASCVASCVLLVTPDDYGRRCRFEGEETACGQCVATQCQAVVDDCCRADSCSPGLRVVEECAKGDRRLCELLASDLQARDPARVALATCVTSRCEAICKQGAAVSLTKCDESSLGFGKTCSCKLAPDANQTECSEARYPETLCCAPESWPAAGQKCQCNTVSCTATAEGCSCLLFDIPTESKVCSGAVCCQDADSCRCGPNACAGRAVQVPSCSIATIGCPPNQKRVASCAVTTP